MNRSIYQTICGTHDYCGETVCVSIFCYYYYSTILTVALVGSGGSGMAGRAMLQPNPRKRLSLQCNSRTEDELHPLMEFAGRETCENFKVVESGEIAKINDDFYRIAISDLQVQQ